MVIQAITTFSYQGTLSWNKRKFPEPGWSLLCNHTSCVAGSKDCRLITALHIAYVTAVWEDCTLPLAGSASSFPHERWHERYSAKGMCCKLLTSARMPACDSHKRAPAGFPKELTMAFVQSNSKRKEAMFFHRGTRKPASPRESDTMWH